MWITRETLVTIFLESIKCKKLFTYIEMTIRFIVVLRVRMFRLLKGFYIDLPLDPHNINIRSLEISRSIQEESAENLINYEDGNQRLDILPSILKSFKEVIFIPPVLFDSTKVGFQVFHNARLAGRDAIAFSSQGKLIQESLFRTRDRNIASLSHLSNNELKTLYKFPRKKNVFMNGKYCQLISFWDNFGHWIPEHLLKIKYLLDSGFDLAHLKFIVRAPVDPYKIFFLTSLGILPQQIVEWRKGLAVVEELVVPEYPQISSEGLEWINNIVPDNNSNVNDESLFIYLSRNKQVHRKIINEEELSSVLNKYNFTTIYPEELDIHTQIDLARKAKIFFGPQGSAFTLQIFMPRGGYVIEAFPRNRIHLFNRQVALIKGHQHLILTDPRGQDASIRADKDVMVDTNRLSDFLRILMSN